MFRLALWEPYGLPWVRWMAFLSIQGYVLQFSVGLYFASRRPSPAPSTPYSLHLCAASSQTLSLLWVSCGYGSHCKKRKVGGRTTGRSRLDTGTEVSQLTQRLRCVPGSRAYGSYFRAPLMNRASALRSRCVGAEEDCWLSEKTFQAFLCLSDAARRSAFRGTRTKGEGGTETLG